MATSEAALGASGDLLSTAEGNALSAALLRETVSKLTVRAVLIKGLPLRSHGLRAGHNSADVDLMVEPGSSDEVIRSLASLGWTVRPSTTPGERISLHSVTLCHQAWPNDIDLHHDFPGLLAGPERAFEVLWEHREQMLVAGFPCWMPDRASSIVIWALHSLRGTHTQPRHAIELAQLVNDVLPKLSEAERRELADRIVELGADEPLRVVPEFAEIIGDRRGPQAPGALEAWLGKVAQAHEVTPWLQVLREARPAERPGLVLRAIWPSAHDLRLTDEFLVDTPLGRVQSRGRRAWRLVRRYVERSRQTH